MRLAILGSTGSIGHSALAVVDAHADRLQVIGLAAGTSATAMALQVERYRPRAVVMATDAACETLRGQLPTGAAAHLDLCGAGPQRLNRPGHARRRRHRAVRVVRHRRAGGGGRGDPGTARRVALANKEVLVMAGAPRDRSLARARGVAVLPVDSEHNAIHQCLRRRTIHRSASA